MLLHRKVNTQEGYSGFQVTGMIEWGQKSKPEKITGPKFIRQKISRQATKTNTRQNFPTQKNPEIKNFKPPKILQSSLSLETRSTPPPPLPLEGGGGEYKIFNPGLALIGLSGIGASGVPTSNTISPGLTKIGLKMRLGNRM